MEAEISAGKREKVKASLRKRRGVCSSAALGGNAASSISSLSCLHGCWENFPDKMLRASDDVLDFSFLLLEEKDTKKSSLLSFREI